MTEDTSAAAPAMPATSAGTVAAEGPPVGRAGAVESEGTGVPAGSPLIEPDPKDPPPDAVMLKVAEPHSEFQVFDAVVGPEYQPFSAQQAAALTESAAAAGVTLINQADEEATGGTPSA